MSETSRARILRRRFGVGCIGGAILMLLAGETVMRSVLAGVGLVVYWLICLVLTAVAAGVAIIDAARVRWESREEQRSLLESTLREVEQEQQARKKSKR